MQTQHRAVALLLWCCGVGCSGPQGQAAEGVDMIEGSSRRFEARALPSRGGLEFDEFGKPSDLRTSVLTDGKCFAVTEFPGRHVCVTSNDILFETGRSGGSQFPGTFIGDSSHMTLHAASAHASALRAGTTYERWFFEDVDDPHADTRGDYNEDQTRPPAWFDTMKAPALYIESSGTRTRRAVLRCGAAAHELELLDPEASIRELGAARFSAPASIESNALETKGGTLVVVVQMLDHIGRLHIEAEIDGAPVAVIRSWSRGNHFAVTFRNGFELVGGGQINFSHESRSLQRARDEPSLRLRSTRSDLASAAIGRLEAKLLSTVDVADKERFDPCAGLLGGT